jgi:hypothetical protein
LIAKFNGNDEYPPLLMAPPGTEGRTAGTCLQGVTPVLLLDCTTIRTDHRPPSAAMSSPQSENDARVKAAAPTRLQKLIVKKAHRSRWTCTTDQDPQFESTRHAPGVEMGVGNTDRSHLVNEDFVLSGRNRCLETGGASSIGSGIISRTDRISARIRQLEKVPALVVR